MTDAFSTPAEHAFEHDEINGAIAGPSTMGDATEELSLEEAFEVEDTIQRIRAGGYKTVSDIGVIYGSQNRWLLDLDR
jgi:diphthamide biosynthesis protein 2